MSPDERHPRKSTCLDGSPDMFSNSKGGKVRLEVRSPLESVARVRVRGFESEFWVTNKKADNESICSPITNNNKFATNTTATPLCLLPSIHSIQRVPAGLHVRGMSPVWPKHAMGRRAGFFRLYYMWNTFKSDPNNARVPSGFLRDLLGSWGLLHLGLG